MTLGPKSLIQKDTLHPKLQQVINKLVELNFNFSILQGVRTLDQEKALVASGASTTINSKHLPDTNGKSRAMDIALNPISWNNTEQFVLFAGYVLGLADAMGIKLIWGGDWNRDFNTLDTGFRDLDHFELDKSEE